MVKIYSCSGLSLCLIEAGDEAGDSVIESDFNEAGDGVIESDFRGNIEVVLHNHADIVAEFEPGERIAQVVFQKFESPQFKEVFDLDVTETN